MKTKHGHLTCKRCRRALGYAVTFTEAHRVKMVIFVTCSHCGNEEKAMVTVGSDHTDPDQLKLSMFQGTKI